MKKTLLVSLACATATLLVAEAQEDTSNVAPASDRGLAGARDEMIVELEGRIAGLEHKLDFITAEILDRYGIYVVKPGDTFSKIAHAFATTQERLIELNPHVVDPRRLQIATIIRIRECERGANQLAEATPVEPAEKREPWSQSCARLGAPHEYRWGNEESANLPDRLVCGDGLRPLGAILRLPQDEPRRVRDSHSACHARE